MRNLTRLTVALMATAFLSVAAAGIAAVGQFSGLEIIAPASGAQSSLDANPAIWIKYISTTSSTPTVEVDATTGDIEFQVDGAADTTLSCPEADLDGVIDVSEAACNTWEEVVNAINMGGSNWRGVLGPVLATELTTDVLATLAETDDDLSVGRGLYYDDAYAGATITTTIGLYPVGVGAVSPTNGSFFFSGRDLNRNPFKNLISLLTYFSAKQTSTGTISNTIVFGVKREYKGNPTIGYNLSEQSRTAWTETGGATTVENQTDFSNFPLISAPGEIFLLRTGSSTNLTAINNVVAGAFAKK